MGDLLYIADLRALGPDVVTVDRTHILLPESVFLRLGEYSGTLPTGPKPGRVYRRDWNDNLNRARRAQGLEPLPPEWRVHICDVALDPQGRPPLVSSRHPRGAIDHHAKIPVFV